MAYDVKIREVRSWEIIELLRSEESESNTVLRLFQECCKSLSRVLRGCVNDISGVFQKYFRGVSRLFPGCSKVF